MEFPFRSLHSCIAVYDNFVFLKKRTTFRMLWLGVLHFTLFTSFIYINYIENSFHKAYSVFICLIYLKSYELNIIKIIFTNIILVLTAFCYWAVLIFINLMLSAWILTLFRHICSSGVCMHPCTMFPAMALQLLIMIIIWQMLVGHC